MSSVSAQLSNVVSNTRKLLALCESLQQDNDLLKLELQSLQVALDTSQAQTKQLEEQVKALTVARTLEEKDPANDVLNEKILDTKQKINDFVREIDKCIDLLK